MSFVFARACPRFRPLASAALSSSAAVGLPEFRKRPTRRRELASQTAAALDHRLVLDKRAARLSLAF
jgi:hypothetical protein